MYRIDTLINYSALRCMEMACRIARWRSGAVMENREDGMQAARGSYSWRTQICERPNMGTPI
jgi:hypothetical protein